MKYSRDLLLAIIDGKAACPPTLKVTERNCKADHAMNGKVVEYKGNGFCVLCGRDTLRRANQHEYARKNGARNKAALDAYDERQRADIDPLWD